MSTSSKIMRMALFQLKVHKDTATNVINVVSKIKEIVKKYKPRIITLPECFAISFGFRKYSERVPDGYICQQLSKAASDNQVYIVGGTIPELSEDKNKAYNTCTVWGPNGDLIAKHRKIHMFDIDIKDVIRYNESRSVYPGRDLTFFNVDGHKIGIGICHDMRFEEMARLYRIEGCEMIIYPAVFNLVTGPLQWEVLQRARAMDNQLYVVTSSAAKDISAGYVVYGHSMIVDPWGKVLKDLGEDEQIAIADIDFSLVEQARQQLPLFNQRRLDLYGPERK